jgi:hypothetical protein
MEGMQLMINVVVGDAFSHVCVLPYINYRIPTESKHELLTSIGTVVT